MAKLNLMLLAVTVACALSLVTSRHQARKLFVELERAIVERAGQSESVFDECLFAAAITVEHRADLRHRRVRLVDE